MDFVAIAKMTEEMPLEMCALTVVSLAWGIVYYVGYWCLLQKMGRHDFAALVPFYRIWEYARGAGMSSALAFIALLAAIVLVALNASFLITFGYDGFWDDFWHASIALNDGGAGAWSLVGELIAIQLSTFNPRLYSILAVVCVSVLLHIYASYGVARSFDHGVGFTLGLVIVPLIFVPLLGLSHNQTYTGPYLDHSQRTFTVNNWNAAVQSRLDAFGNNAPCALALLSLMSGALGMTLAGIVLGITALVRNRSEKSKSLAHPKYTVALVLAWLGIVVSIGMFVAMLTFGLLANAVESL